MFGAVGVVIVKTTVAVFLFALAKLTVRIEFIVFVCINVFIYIKYNVHMKN